MQRSFLCVVFSLFFYLLSTNSSAAPPPILSGRFTYSDERIVLEEGACEQRVQLVRFHPTVTGYYNISALGGGFRTARFAVYNPDVYSSFPLDDVVVAPVAVPYYEGPPATAYLLGTEQYELAVFAPCPSFEPGAWAIVFRNGPGVVESVATIDSLDSFNSGHITSAGALKVNTDCGGPDSPRASVELDPIRVAQSGEYQFISDETNEGAVCVRVYTQVFDPQRPMENLVSRDVGWARQSAYLQAGMNYYLVVQPVYDTDVDYFFLTAPTDDTPLIDDTMTGNWANPETPGQGFFIEAIEGPDPAAFVGWFTFNLANQPPSSPGVGDGSQRWLLGVGEYRDEPQPKLDLAVEVTSGTSFNSAGPGLEQISRGQIQLAFQSCNGGMLNYDLGNGQSGSFPIRRLSGAAGVRCFYADPFHRNSVSYSTGREFSGSWINPETPGQGLFIEVMGASKQAVVGWLTYEDPASPNSVGAAGQRWLTAFGPVNQDVAELQVEVSSGGRFNAPGPAPSQAVSGTMTVEIFDCERGQITFDLSNVDRQGVIPIRRLSNSGLDSCKRRQTRPGIPAKLSLN